MGDNINWKLVGFVSVPAGLLLGWIFRLSLGKFLKYVVLLLLLSVVGAIVYNISEHHKKTNMFNAIVLTIAILLLMNLLRQL